MAEGSQRLSSQASESKSIKARGPSRLRQNHVGPAEMTLKDKSCTLYGCTVSGVCNQTSDLSSFALLNDSVSESADPWILNESVHHKGPPSLIRLDCLKPGARNFSASLISNCQLETIDPTKLQLEPVFCETDCEKKTGKQMQDDTLFLGP